MPQSSSVWPLSLLAKVPLVVFTVVPVSALPDARVHSGVVQLPSVLCAICHCVFWCPSASVPSENAVPESTGLLLPPPELLVGVEGANFMSYVKLFDVYEVSEVMFIEPSATVPGMTAEGIEVCVHVEAPDVTSPPLKETLLVTENAEGHEPLWHRWSPAIAIVSPCPPLRLSGVVELILGNTLNPFESYALSVFDPVSDALVILTSPRYTVSPIAVGTVTSMEVLPHETMDADTVPNPRVKSTVPCVAPNRALLAVELVSVMFSPSRAALDTEGVLTRLTLGYM